MIIIFFVFIFIQDLEKYLALSILMAIFSRPRIPDYWSTDAIGYSPIFPTLISRNQYQLITKMLHFADNSYWDPTDENRDRLYKIRPVLDYLGDRFQANYTPTKNISIDEQLLLHKGNLSFKMYIPNKRSRFGIKFFSLCDETGYLYKMECYTGKNAHYVDTFEEKYGPLGKSGETVMRLMIGELGFGHHLYLDNW